MEPLQLAMNLACHIETNCSRKRVDMMTFCNCGITPNRILNVHRITHPVMDVAIGHTYSMQYDMKPNTLREMDS